MTQNWLKERKVKAVFFPAKGADMNPIENLWAIMSGKVYGATKTFTDKATLEAAIRAAWADIQSDKDLRAKLVGSMQRRLAEVVKRKGDWISF